MKIYDVIILGAGASGLMCAASMSKKKSIAIIDVNDKIAKKLQISGGGKCNITNVFVAKENFDGDEALVKYVLQRFSRDSLLRFLHRNQIELDLRKERYYFCQKSSQEIINALYKSCKGIEIILQTQIKTLVKKEDFFEIRTDKSVLLAKKVVVATGGKSFTHLGASEIGLELAKSFEIEVKDFTPALVGLTLQKEQFWMRELSGLSAFVHIKVEDKILKEEMLFTHKGISGPAVLSASLYWRTGEMRIDFLANNPITQMIQGSKKLLSSTLPLPKRLSIALLKELGVKDKECKNITPEDMRKLQNIHNYSFSPAGNFGFSKAEVSRGGIVAEELYKESLESKKISGLYFIGEVVDVTGELGGYNFQWAFSSAYVCAKAMK